MQYRAVRECVIYWPDERGTVPPKLLKTKSGFHLRPEKPIGLCDFWETETDTKCYSEQVRQTSFRKDFFVCFVNLAHLLWIHASFWRTLELFQRQRWGETSERDGMERKWTFPSAQIPSWTELNALLYLWSRQIVGLPIDSVITTRTYCALL